MRVLGAQIFHNSVSNGLSAHSNLTVNYTAQVCQIDLSEQSFDRTN